MMGTIIFFILCINITVQGMFKVDGDNSSVFCHPDLIPQITEYLCLSYKRPYTRRWDAVALKKDIKSLSCSNEFLRNYYAQEENAQKIIRWCSVCFKSSDYNIAKKLGYDSIALIINCFFDFCNKPRYSNETNIFTQEDLEDPWYLNSTDHIHQSLLYKTIDTFRFKNAQLIIDHTPVLHFRYHLGGKDILRNIIELRHEYRKWKDIPATLLSIAQQLLKKGLSVHRITGKGYIPLVTVASFGDKDFARLLLTHGADPEVKQYDMYTDRFSDAFEMERGEPKGWLKTMVEQLNRETM